MAAIVVRVAAAADPSLSNVFRGFEEGAKRARDNAGRFAKQSQKQQTDAFGVLQAQNLKVIQEYRKLAEAKRRIDQQARASGEADQKRRLRAQIDEERRAAQRKVDIEKRLWDEKLREAQRAKRKEEAAATSKKNREAGELRREQRSLGRDFASRSTSNIAGIARGAAGVAGSVVRSTGFDPSLEGMFGRNIDLERVSVALSNQGVNVAEGKARVAPEQIAERIRGVADATATDRGAAAAGLDQFVTRTGDLQAGLGMMEDLAKLAKVANADFKDLAGAAGEVSNALGDMPSEQKAKTIASLMNTLAAQGKLGAVELKDMASGFGKPGSASTRFEGDSADNIKLMGAFVQLARKSGGASSAREAATAVSGMANTFATPARVKAFEKENISVFNQETGLIRNPEELVMEALATTKGDPTRFKAMFQNVIGAKPAEALATTFRKTRAGSLESGDSEQEATARGIRAARDELARFKDATIDAKEFADSFGAAMDTTSSKAQLAQNRFDDIAAGALEKMVPAIERAMPSLEKFAGKLADAGGWVVENPGSAATAAIVTSIAHAGLGAAIKSTLENGLKGNLASGLTIATAAITVAAAGITLLDAYYTDKDKRETVDSGKQTDREVLAERAARGQSKMARGLFGQVTEDEHKAMIEAPKLRAQLMSEIELGTGDKRTGFAEGMLNTALGQGKGWDYNEKVQTARENLGQNKAMLAVLDGLAPDITGAIKSGFDSAQVNVVVNVAADGTPSEGRRVMGPLGERQRGEL